MTSTPDTITVLDSGPKFAPHPAGQFAAVCVDTINLGDRLKTYAGQSPYVAPQCAVVFWTGERNEETGELFEVSMEFTVSMFERAGLRLFLESWRGKSYTPDEAKAGVPLHKLVRVPALISVEHKESAKKRVYSRVKSIAPLPKQMPRPDLDLDAYERAEFWTERKTNYRAEVAKFRGEHVPQGDDFTDGSNGHEDDLPF